MANAALLYFKFAIKIIIPNLVGLLYCSSDFIFGGENIKQYKIVLLIFGLFLLALGLILYFVISQANARNEAREYIDIQQTYTAVVEPPILEAEEAVEPESEGVVEPQLQTIAVDFAALRAINPDTIGWLAIPDTPISYPVMQAGDNNYYLNRSSTGNRSSAGAVFLDSSNGVNPLDQNSILYGHNMGNGREAEMFGPLLSYKERTYYDAHRMIQFDTHLEAYGWWEIFAVLHLDLRDTEFKYLRQTFLSEADFAQWLEQVKARSLYDTGVEVSASDRILTLSTCDRSKYRGNGRFVVMAVWRGNGMG